MKKLIFLFSVAITMIACNKEKEVNFTPSDILGEATITGIVTKQILPSGKIPVEGVKVIVTVKKSELYPNSKSAIGVETFEDVTNAEGEYSITIKTNAEGVSAFVSTSGFIGTLDAYSGGELTVGERALFTSQTDTITVKTGVNEVSDISITGTQIGAASDAVSIGKATVRGYVYILDKGEKDYLSNHTVVLTLDKDPFTNAEKVYTTKTDAKGSYVFTIETVESGTKDYEQKATVKAYDFEARQRIYDLGDDKWKTEDKDGVYSAPATINLTAVYNNSIQVGKDIAYSAFTPIN